MSFLNLTWPLVAAGVAFLAAGFYWLQRLRVRHRRVPVVTTMFWKEAVEESHARRLDKRFRHPLAYALILLIGLLLWFGVAGIRRGGRVHQTHIVLLDGSARMARGDLFARAKRTAIEHAAAWRPEAREVVLCGSAPRRVLAPGEDLRLLEERLADRTPEACPSTLDAVLREMTRGEIRDATFLVVTDAATWPTDAAGLVDNRVQVAALDAGQSTNTGIVALGLSDAASGRFDAVDAYIEVRRPRDPASEESAPPRLQSRLGEGPATELAPPSPDAPRSAWRFWLRDLPTEGATLTVTLLTASAPIQDDEAAIVLPQRRIVRVGIDPTLVALMGPVVAADPALALADGTADVVVRRGVQTAPPGVPVLRFVAEAPGTPMLRITDPHGAEDADALLRSVVGVLRLDEIDAVALATDVGRPVEVVAEAGEARGLAFWESLTTKRHDLIYTRTFPALLSRSLRWLAGVEYAMSTVAVGEPLDAPIERLVDAAGQVHDAVDVPATPPAAGRYEGRAADTGQAVVQVASLLVPAFIGGPLADSEGLDRVAAGGVSAPLVSWLLLAAFLLLGLEWFLFRTERIP